MRCVAQDGSSVQCYRKPLKMGVFTFKLPPMFFEISSIPLTTVNLDKLFLENMFFFSVRKCNICSLLLALFTALQFPCH